MGILICGPLDPPLFPQAQRHISDLYEDLRDGHNLISLLEVLSGDSLVCVPLPACFLPRGLSHYPLGVQLGLSPSPASSSPDCSPLARVLALQPQGQAYEWPRPPRCSLHLSPNTVTSCSALLWFLCCLDSES